MGLNAGTGQAEHPQEVSSSCGCFVYCMFTGSVMNYAQSGFRLSSHEVTQLLSCSCLEIIITYTII